LSSIFRPRKWWVLAFVVNTHERPLLNFALRLTCNREDAYDLLQAQYNKSVNLLQSDNEFCKLCSENCKLSHRCSSLLILSKTLLSSY